jgi:hypothetical protein
VRRLGLGEAFLRRAFAAHYMVVAAGLIAIDAAGGS